MHSRSKERLLDQVAMTSTRKIQRFLPERQSVRMTEGHLGKHRHPKIRGPAFPLFLGVCESSLRKMVTWNHQEG